jgi:hypothetical protein
MCKHTHSCVMLNTGPAIPAGPRSDLRSVIDYSDARSSIAVETVRSGNRLDAGSARGIEPMRVLAYVLTTGERLMDRAEQVKGRR